MRGADPVRFLASAALVVLSAALCRAVFLPSDPASTPIRIVDSAPYASASPAGLRPPADTGNIVRFAFTGDIMQHHAQRDDDFAVSYGRIAPSLRGFAAVVGNLEFPVDSTAAVGPARGSTTFNGSAAHLSALAAAGFTVLSVANNHALDQGPAGLARTVAAIQGRGMAALGAAGPGGAEQAPVVVRAHGLAVALLAYSIPPNQFPGGGDSLEWPARNTALTLLNLRGWEAEFRDSGRALLSRQAAAARAGGADLVVAFVHWGEEWHLQPSADQRAAAHDIIDAGFDLVVGAHPHVLQGIEIYRDHLIAYSLGDFISDFAPLAARTGGILQVEVVRDGPGARVAGFALEPVTVRRRGHIVEPLVRGSEGWELACRVLGAGVAGCAL